MSIETPAERSAVRHRLSPFSRPLFAFGLAAISAVLLVVFHAAPSIDLAVSDVFFLPEPCPAGTDPAIRCGVFPLSSAPNFSVLRQTLRYLPIAAAASVIGLALWNQLRDRWGRPWQGAALLALLSVAIGTLLITDTLLKTYGGRPRPYETTLFGGTLAFVPAGDFGGQCRSNCSFVSSEASAAFWLVCLVVLLPRPWRPFAAAVALIVAAGTAALRVAFGAHFFSDVTMAGLWSILAFSLIAVIACAIVERRGRS